MNASFTDVRFLQSTLRRRAKILIAAALIGLAAGVAYVLVLPPALTSTALILLPTPANIEDANSDVDTQVRIALSASRLEQAGQSVDPPLSDAQIKKLIDVSAPTNQLIQIEATSTDGRVAQQVAEAVADAYVNYVRNTAREVTTVALANLTKRRDELQEQIKQLQKVINDTRDRQREVDADSSEGREEARLLAGLQTEQANLALQLDRVQDSIAVGTPVTTAAGAGTLVIQPSTIATAAPLWLRLLTWGSAGALACALLALLVVLAAAGRDPRLRLRDDIADAVGSPVLAAVRSRPQRSVAAWSTLLERYHASPVEAWAFRQVLRGLVPTDRRGHGRSGGRVDHPQTLTVVSLAGDQRGLAIGPQLAAFAADIGLVTLLRTTVGHVRAPHLWGACADERQGLARPGLFVGKAPDDTAVDLTIYLVVAERIHPYLGDTPAAAATVLAVGSATATAQDLARLAVAVDDAGRRIDGIVVADPDQSDRTSGRHTLDERSRHLDLPTRLTGIAADGTERAQRQGHS